MNLVTCYEPGVSYKEMPCEKLEPCEGKLSCTVLRGGNGSNAVLLPDQTVENKQKFISQIMTSKSPVRSCEDIDEAALSYAEIKALCAGDPAIKEKMDLDVDVARLRLMKADHQSQQYRLEDRLLKYFPQEIERNKGYIRGFEQDQARVTAHPLPEKDFVGITILGKDYADKEKAGEAILAACKSVKNHRQSIHSDLKR